MQEINVIWWIGKFPLIELMSKFEEADPDVDMPEMLEVNMLVPVQRQE